MLRNVVDENPTFGGVAATDEKQTSESGYQETDRVTEQYMNYQEDEKSHGYDDDWLALEEDESAYAYNNLSDSYLEKNLKLRDYYRDGYHRERDPMEQEIGSYMDDSVTRSRYGRSKGLAKGHQLPGVAQSDQRSRKNISRGRLREAVVWSEILGPPVCKRRREDKRNYRKTS